jgi:hypothetical protein
MRPGSHRAGAGIQPPRFVTEGRPRPAAPLPVALDASSGPLSKRAGQVRHR